MYLGVEAGLRKGRRAWKELQEAELRVDGVLKAASRGEASASGSRRRSLRFEQNASGRAARLRGEQGRAL